MKVIILLLVCKMKSFIDHKVSIQQTHLVTPLKLLSTIKLVIFSFVSPVFLSFTGVYIHVEYTLK